MITIRVYEEGCCIDTLYLVAILGSKQVEEILNTIKFRYFRGNKIWKYFLESDEENGLEKYYIKFLPVTGENKFLGMHYTIEIQLQYVSIYNPPKIIQFLLSVGKWKIKRIDIAFDFEVPLTKTFIYTTSRQKKILYGNNKYVYGKNSPRQLSLYDKRKHLIECKDTTIPIESLTRLEVRLRPKLSENRFLDGDLSWIDNELDKILFSLSKTNIKRSLVKKEDKDAFDKLKRRLDHGWSTLPKGQAERIKRSIISNAVNIKNIYQEHQIENIIRNIK